MKRTAEVLVGSFSSLLPIRPEAFLAILNDLAPSDPRAKKVKPEDFHRQEILRTVY